MRGGDKRTGELFSYVDTAEVPFKGIVTFDPGVVDEIVQISEGFPYFAKLIGKGCVEYGKEVGTNEIDGKIFVEIMERIRIGKSFPNLEEQYQLAIGKSKERAMLLVLLAEQKSESAHYDEELSRVVLQKTRAAAQGLEIEYIDQLMPRLVEERYGPALVKGSE
jgi:hypothetical protein